MFKKFYVLTLLAAVFIVTPFSSANAKSAAEFPKDWEKWPIISTGSIPSSDKPISKDLPPIVQETFKTYNWINDGKGSKYNVRVNPNQRKAFDARTDFEDAPTSLMELTDIKVLFVTDHLAGEAQYGVYTFDGKDMTEAHPSLATKNCVNCHDGYKDVCSNGVCAKAQQ